MLSSPSNNMVRADRDQTEYSQHKYRLLMRHKLHMPNPAPIPKKP